MAKTRAKAPYWIISSHKRSSIWEKPYIKEMECLTEFRTQMEKVRKEKGEEFMKRVDWEIQQHWYEIEKDTSDDDFDKF